MKKLIIGLFGVVALAGLLAFNTGCKTVITKNDNGTITTNQVVNSAAVVPVIQGVVPVAVQVAVAKETNAAPYLRAVTVVLDAVVTSGNYNPANVQAAIDGLKLKGNYSQQGDIAVQAGLSLYKAFAADAVTAKLSANEVLPVLQAFSDAIKQGLAFSAAPNAGVSLPVTTVGAAAPAGTVIQIRVK